MYASDLICDRHKYTFKGQAPEEYYGQCYNCDQRIDRIKSAEIKVGDLVRIKPWCKNKHRLASVVDVMWFDTRSIIIQYLDEQGLGHPPSKAISANLEVISESR